MKCHTKKKKKKCGLQKKIYVYAHLEYAQKKTSIYNIFIAGYNYIFKYKKKRKSITSLRNKSSRFGYLQKKIGWFYLAYFFFATNN